jgi:hypothetical protein
MTRTRTGIIPGLPLRAAGLLWQRFGAEPHELELWHVNTGQVDPSFETSLDVSGDTTITTAMPQIFGAYYAEDHDWAWEWPKVSRAEGAGLSLHALAFGAWAPNAATATVEPVVAGTPTEPRPPGNVFTPIQTDDLMRDTAFWPLNRPTQATVYGLRSMGVRYAEFSLFAVSCADAQFASSMIPTQATGADAPVDLTDDGGLPELQEAELLVNYNDQGLSAYATASVVVMVLDYRQLEANAYGGY